MNLETGNLPNGYILVLAHKKGEILTQFAVFIDEKDAPKDTHFPESMERMLKILREREADFNPSE